jgi:hypothetical protein
MSEQSERASQAGPSHRGVEIGVALLMAAFALVVIGGSMKAGIDWAFDGPRAGFFPFYIGLLILAASIFNLIQAWSGGRSDRLFADWGQLGQVMAVVIPSAIYVALIPWVGLYVCSAMLVAVFMKWLGKYGWGLTAAISLGVPVATFIVFEKWFLVPLPKGPIENFLGY